MRAAILPLLTAISLTLSACDATDDGGNGGCGSGTMTATVAGASFAATCVTGSFTSGVLTVGGNLGASQGGSQEQITIALPGATAGGSVSLGFGPTATYAKIVGTDASQTYVATSGTVRVTAVSASGATGTFSFTGRTNGGQTISVASGTFDIAF